MAKSGEGLASGTNIRMTRNIALYESLGYAETEREPLPDRVILHMSKRLAAA